MRLKTLDRLSTMRFVFRWGDLIFRQNAEPDLVSVFGQTRLQQQHQAQLPPLTWHSSDEKKREKRIISFVCYLCSFCSFFFIFLSSSTSRFRTHSLLNDARTHFIKILWLAPISLSLSLFPLSLPLKLDRPTSPLSSLKKLSWSIYLFRWKREARQPKALLFFPPN